MESVQLAAVPEGGAEIATDAVHDGRVEARHAGEQHDDGQQAACGGKHAELRRGMCQVPCRCPRQRVRPLALRDGLPFGVAVMLMQARVGSP